MYHFSIIYLFYHIFHLLSHTNSHPIKGARLIIVFHLVFQHRFYVDEIPIRELIRTASMRGDFPSKPMSVYATIWDASSWATNGGKKKVDYQHQPFVAEFRDLVLEGCIVDPVDQLQSSDCSGMVAALMEKDYSTITAEGRKSMRWFRQRYMYYSYCYDNKRYPVPPPECVVVPSERDLLRNGGRRPTIKFSGDHRRRQRAQRRGKAARHQAVM